LREDSTKKEGLVKAEKEASCITKAFGFVEQVMNDMRKRQSHFQLGLLTVFMVVTFSTLLVAFLNASGSIFFMIGQANAGDFDITISALQESEVYEEADPNFYTDM